MRSVRDSLRTVVANTPPSPTVRRIGYVSVLLNFAFLALDVWTHEAPTWPDVALHSVGFAFSLALIFLNATQVQRLLLAALTRGKS